MVDKHFFKCSVSKNWKCMLLVLLISRFSLYAFSFLDSSIPEPNSRQIKCLKMYFGHYNFKP